MESVSMMMFVLLFSGGGDAGDLLDFTPTEIYWQMRDERIVDFDSMSAVLQDDDATPTDTLMAIRSLGEWVLIQEADPDIQADPAHKAKALKLLTPFVGSKEPFVDQYAKRSVAWLKGEDPEDRPALPAEVYDLDLALLPSDSTFVGQLKVQNGVGPINLAELFPDIKIEGESVRDMMMQELLPGLTQSVAMIGNARADLVTGGMILNDEEDVSFALIIRGQYDRVGVQITLEEAMGEDDKASFYSVGDVEVVAVMNHDPFALLMPSDELFIVLFSERRGSKLPIDEVAKKLQQADRKPTFDASLEKQVAAVPRDKADVWIAMKVTQMMREEREFRDVIGAFDAGRAFATRDSKGMMDIKWVAEGSNADDVARTVAFCTEGIQEGITELTREKQHMPPQMRPMMDQMVEMLKSMEFKQDGKTMTGGMQVDPGMATSMPMMMFGMRVDHHQHEADFAADAVELEAVQE